MKLKGQTIPPPEPVAIKFYRAQTIIELRVQAVLSFEQFDRLVPFPKPPLVTKIRDNRSYHDFDDKNYLRQIDQYSTKKSEYMIIKGLEATQELEWDTVKINEPDTWSNYRQELLQSFTESEISQLVQSVNEANNPTEKRLMEAFNSFTPSQDQQGAEPVPSSHAVAQPGTESGGPASDSK